MTLIIERVIELEWYELRRLIKDIDTKLHEQVGTSDAALKVESIKKMVREFYEKYG